LVLYMKGIMRDTFNTLRRHAALGGLCLAQMIWAANGFAGGEAVITAATGGEAISADTAGGAWTTLTGPVIKETYARDIGYLSPGTLVLQAPAGFEFNVDAPTVVRISGEGKKTINGADDQDTLPVTKTTTTLSVNITATSRGGYAYPDTLTWENIQVRPLSGSSLAQGDLTQTGDCQLRNLTLLSGTWGVLHEVGGILAGYVITPGGPVTAGSPVTVTIQKVDQYGNPLPGGGSSTLIFDGLGSNGGDGPTVDGLPLGTGVEVTFDANGTAVVTLVAYKAETGTLTVTNSDDGAITGSVEILVSSGSAAAIALNSGSLQVVYGTTFNLSVQSMDLYGNPTSVGLPANLLVSLGFEGGEASLIGATALNIGTAGGNGIVSFDNLQISEAGGFDIIPTSVLLANGSVHVTVAPLVVTPTVAIGNKTYDGSTLATVESASLIGTLPGDDVILVLGVEPSFADKNAGQGKPVSISGLGLVGLAAKNYLLSQHELMAYADITARALAVTPQVGNKVYDGTKGAPVTLTDNRIAGDEITVTFESASFETGSAGQQQNLVVTGIAVQGLDAANYTAPETVSTLASIAKAKITVTPDNKSRAVGQSNPELTGAVEGVLDGDGISFTFSTTADLGSPAGQYAIVPTATDPQGRLANYELVANPGVLEITTASLSASLSASQSPSLEGALVSFTARLGTQFAGGVLNSEFPPELKPTGTIVFRVNGTALGEPVAVVDGQATLSTSGLPTGTNVVIAEYAGDANFTGANASVVQFVGIILPEPTIINVKDNGDKTITITFLGTAGREYIVQATSDLTIPVTWENVSTNSAGTWDGTWIYSEDMTRYQQRFFRAVNP
jgi:hypothetical protein